MEQTQKLEVYKSKKNCVYWLFVLKEYFKNIPREIIYLIIDFAYDRIHMSCVSYGFVLYGNETIIQKEKITKLDLKIKSIVWTTENIMLYIRHDNEIREFFNPSRVLINDKIKSIHNKRCVVLALTETGICYTWNSGRDIFEKVNFEDHNTYIVSADVGISHYVALEKTGNVFVWGFGFNFELGLPIPQCLLHPKQLDVRDIVLISCGEYHNFAVGKDNSLYAWGSCYEISKFSIAFSFAIPQKIPIEFEFPIVSIACGFNYNIFLLSNGDCCTWGTNDNKIIPIKINLSNIKSIAYGFHNFIAISKDEHVYIWGKIGTLNLENDPVKLEY